MNKIVLKQMGMNDRIIKAAGEYSGLYPGRVVSQYKDAYRVMTESAVLMAEVSARRRAQPRRSRWLPAISTRSLSAWP